MPVPEAPVVDDVSFIEQLWREYKESSRKELRDRLILHYSPLVKFVAGRVAVGLPHNVEQADLVSYGIFGLMDAIDKYDPARGYKFETYAMSRIKGAIIDELRTIDWVPRSVRAKARAIERAYAKLEGELLRTPEEHEVVAELEMTKVQFAQTLSQISLVGIVPLDELRSIDWVPRSVRAKARSIERAYSKLENENKRTPDDKEIASELGMTDG
ncbi:MAG: sigma-70 family RNA polymerase sigma factor, partial [Acidimicrobiia bacterium]